MIKKSLNVNIVKECVLVLFILFCMAAVLFYPAAATSFTGGLKLWYACVLPTLFPYLFLTALLSETKAVGKAAVKFSPLSEKVFNVNGCSLYAFFLSLVSGYPVGAKTVADLSVKGYLSKAETVRAAALCSTASPVFMIASVGTIAFKSPLFGVLLFITHFISALVMGFIFSFYKRNEKPESPAEISAYRSMNILYESAEKSAITVIAVGGIIALFYLFTDVLSATGVLSFAAKFLSRVFGDSNIGNGIVFSVFECTKGLKTISLSGINFLTLPLCACILGFGGISVIAQSMAFLKSAKIKTATFVLIKLIDAAINFFIGLIFSLIFFF